MGGQVTWSFTCVQHSFPFLFLETLRCSFVGNDIHINQLTYPATMLQQLYPRKDGYADQQLYPYNPSETTAYGFTAMFAIAGFAHLVLMFPYRAWFPVPMIIGTASKYIKENILSQD